MRLLLYGLLAAAALVADPLTILRRVAERSSKDARRRQAARIRMSKIHSLSTFWRLAPLLLIATFLLVLMLPVLGRVRFTLRLGPAGWFLLMALVLVGGYGLLFWNRLRARRFFEAVRGADHLVCPECHYSLLAHTQGGRCPECGYAFDPRTLHEDWKDIQHLARRHLA
ncbi:MAG: hypothetical protein JXQ73_19460 [Phycisphaerae bacterium]|nr:hypothetical protein [Phycisphaerae bacterium]